MENASYSRVRLETAPYSTKFGIGEFVAECNTAQRPYLFVPPHVLTFATFVPKMTCAQYTSANTSTRGLLVVFPALSFSNSDHLSFLPVFSSFAPAFLQES